MNKSITPSLELIIRKAGSITFNADEFFEGNIKQNDEFYLWREDLDQVLPLVEEHGFDAVVATICYCTGWKPQKQYLTTDFKQAYEHIHNNIKSMHSVQQPVFNEYVPEFKIAVE